MERYKRMLQPDAARAKTKWATVDFLNAPVSLACAERWLCKMFIASFQAENPDIDFTSISVLRGIYSRNIQRRAPIYAEFEKGSPQSASDAKATDLAKWQDDSEETARGISEYILGGR